MSKFKISPRGSSWDELEKQLFTPEEIAESEVRVAIINEMIKAREENGITQKQLEAMSGIKQPVISRMEKGTTDPQLSTVLKILTSLGKTIKMVYSARNDPSRNYSFVSRFMRWFVVRYADGIVFQTNQAMNFFSSKIQKKSIVIPNPTYIKKGEYKLPKVRENKIVTVGRLELQKNQKMLIEAFSKVKSVYPNMRLEIYGEGSQRQELEKLIRRLNLCDSVFLMGTCKDIFHKICDAKLFVLSSDFEGMPNALIEAMSLGIPSISTDCPCGGPSMLIKDGVNGYLVPVGDANFLAEKIVEFFGMDNDKKKIFSLQCMRLLDTLEYDKIMKMWHQYITHL